MHVKEFLHISIRSIEGYVKGNSQLIRNKLTISECMDFNLTCIADEDNSRIIWNLTGHNFYKFKSMADYWSTKLMIFL